MIDRDTDKLFLLEENSKEFPNARQQQENGNISSCMDQYYEGMQESIPYTSPPYVRLVLQNLDLYRSPLIQEALHDLLTEPQDLQPFYDDSQKCLGDNKPFASKIIVPPDLTDAETNIAFQYSVHHAAVLEALTTYFEKDFHGLNEIVDKMATSRRKEHIRKRGKKDSFETNMIL